MKKIIIVHGWGGSSKSDWLPWIKTELEKRNVQVTTLEMPDTENPKIKTWTSYLKKQIKGIDKNTYFVGHSIGCQTIIRYLETIDTKIGGVLFVAGWFTLTGLETEEEKKIAKPWIKIDIDFEKVKSKTNKSIALFSDNDPYVPIENWKMFEEKLGSEIIVEQNREHFNEKEEPSVLREILRLVE